MSVAMAIVDFFPVILFLAAAIILQRDLYSEMSKGAFSLFSSGTITVVMAGFFKAVWKLLFCLQICDFQVLNKCFFPMQTTGFVLAAFGIIAAVTHKQGETLYSAAAVPVFSGTMLFVVLMILGVAGLYLGLIVKALQRKKGKCIPILVISFLCVLGMGYMSTKDFQNPMMNWVAEGINTCGQGGLLLAAVKLRTKKENIE